MEIGGGAKQKFFHWKPKESEQEAGSQDHLRGCFVEESLEKSFNEEVERYRTILLVCAKKSEWNSFKTNAGKLFDYCESIEMSVLEKKFFNISRVIMAVLIAVVFALFRIDPDIQWGTLRLREVMILTAIGGCGFELYFFINFKSYMVCKISNYKYRRERFIRNIESDFRTS